MARLARPADKEADDGLLIRQTLRDLLADPICPAAAKAQAARTLAEMGGLLGKHQDKPDRQDSTPLSALSHADLLRELRRLQGLEP